MADLPDFESVYRLYFNDVYKYILYLCKSETIAEEITQETFFKALKSLDSFDGKCKLYVWLCQIAKNTYFTYCKKQKRAGVVAEESDLVSHENIEKDYINKEAASDALAFIHNLEEPYKEVFLLRHYADLPFQQIGALFGKTESWARVVYHRARIKIQEELQ